MRQARAAVQSERLQCLQPIERRQRRQALYPRGRRRSASASAGGAAPGDTDNDGINADAVLGGEGAVDLGCAHALL